MTFRDLKADEIDVRVARVKTNGVALLLYKDARCDMNILDESVGSMNWQRHHNRDNANCIVSIWDDEKKCWIEKEDTGTESNTEAVKGLASDSFKRACFNWGIGRELYTAPFIWIKREYYDGDDNGKPRDDFSVADIVIENKRIVGLSIRNNSSKKIVYTYGNTTMKKSQADSSPARQTQTEQQPAEKKSVSPDLISIGAELKKYCLQFGYNLKDIVKERNLTAESKYKDYADAVNYVMDKAVKEGKI